MSGHNGFDLQTMVSGVIKTAQAKIAEEGDSAKCDSCGYALEHGECPKCDHAKGDKPSGPPAAMEAEKTASALEYLASAIYHGQLVEHDDSLSIEKVAEAYRIVTAVEADPHLAFRIKAAMSEGIGPNDGGEVVPHDLHSPPGGGGTQQRATAKAPASLQIPRQARTAPGIGPNDGGEALATDVNSPPGGGGAYPETGVIRKTAYTGHGAPRITQRPTYELSNKELERKYQNARGEMGIRAGVSGAQGAVAGAALLGGLGAALGGRAALAGTALGALTGGGVGAGLSATSSGLKRLEASREMIRRGESHRDANQRMKSNKQSLKTASGRVLAMGSVLRKMAGDAEDGTDGNLPVGAGQAELGVGTVGSDVSSPASHPGALSEVASNSAAIAYTKAKAKGHPTVVQDLAKVLTHPAMSSAHDDVMQKNLSNTGVSKLAVGLWGSKQVATAKRMMSKAKKTQAAAAEGGGHGGAPTAIPKDMFEEGMKQEAREVMKGRAKQLASGTALTGGAATAIAVPVSAHNKKKQKLASIARRELTQRVLNGEVAPHTLQKLAAVESSEQGRRSISFKQSLQEAARVRGESMNGPAMPIEMPGADPSPATSGY